MVIDVLEGGEGGAHTSLYCRLDPAHCTLSSSYSLLAASLLFSFMFLCTVTHQTSYSQTHIVLHSSLANYSISPSGHCPVIPCKGSGLNDLVDNDGNDAETAVTSSGLTTNGGLSLCCLELAFFTFQ